MATVITIDPPSFSLTSGGSLTLTATLRTSAGTPLAGKTVTWRASRGTLSPASGTTDENGRVRVTYTAPAVTSAENVTIAASFAGDASYEGSSGTSTGTISPLPPAPSSLSVEPSTFTLRSGENLVLIAILLGENGTPLAGKTISWSTAAGSITPATSKTDNLGRAAATFTAPTVTSLTTVTITASFGGDASFGPSQGSSTATVKPPPAKTLLSVRPGSFRVMAGEVVEVVAALTAADGTPLSGKTITWSTTAGRIEARSRATDAVGEVWAKFYTPENVENDLQVTITASFAGDEDSLPSENSSAGVVVPKTLPKTVLTITPTSFNLAPGENIDLRVRLTTEGGTRLAGKPIEWNVNVGQIVPKASSTDTAGEVRATYRAPAAVDANISVTVTASFPGDSGYGPSTDVSRGAVLLPEIKQSLDNIESATATVVSLQELEENLVCLRDAVIRGDVGAALKIGKAPELSVVFFIQENVSARVKEVKERRAEVEVHSDRGRTVLLNIDNEVLPILSEEVQIFVDNVKISMADDYADVLDPTNDDNREEYLILKGAKGAQLLVSIPHFSPKTITISTLPTVPVGGLPNIYLVVVSAIVLIAVILAVIWRYISLGRKKSPEMAGSGRFPPSEPS
jgi:hypothetical protein